MQVEAIKPILRRPGTKRFIVTFDEMLPNVAFDLNLRRYSMWNAAKIVAGILLGCCVRYPLLRCLGYNMRRRAGANGLNEALLAGEAGAAERPANDFDFEASDLSTSDDGDGDTDDDEDDDSGTEAGAYTCPLFSST